MRRREGCGLKRLHEDSGPAKRCEHRRPVATHGRSRMSRLLVFGCLALAPVACRMGTNPSASPVARSPHGAMMRIDWREDHDTFWPETAELVTVADSGLFLLHPPAVVFYPFGIRARVASGQTPGVGTVNLEGPPPAEQLTALARYARHPYGLDDDGLGRLVEALGSDSIRVRGRR